MKGDSLGNTLIDMKNEVTSTHPKYKIFFYILSGNDLQNFNFPPTGMCMVIK